MSPHLYRRILFSNVIYVVLPIVYIAFMLLDFQFSSPILDFHLDQLASPVMIAYCFFAIYLNKLGLSYIGRLGFLILWPILMHVLPIVYLQTPPDYYIAYPLGLIFHAVIIQLLTSSKKERKLFIVLIITNFTFLALSREFLLHFDINPDRSSNAVVGDEYYLLDFILYWLLFNVLTFYVIKAINDLIKKNEEQQYQVQIQNEELSQLNAKIGDINKDLELKVVARTHELREANKILTSVAFYNAHTINGPFCRIKGLKMLANKNAIHATEFMERLEISIEELDDAISNMQHHLNNADKSAES